MIHVQHLSKSYRKSCPGKIWPLRTTTYIQALRDISFNIEAGQVVALLGLNGSGKSTLIKILTGILAPTEGDVKVSGFKPFQERYRYVQNIGVVLGGKSVLWRDVPVIESLKLYADIHAVSPQRLTEQLARFQTIFDIERHLQSTARTLSLGERARIEIIASMLHNPPLLFMDEPTIGLDFIARESVCKFLRSLQVMYGTTIVYSSHILSDIEELCDRAIVLDQGEIIVDTQIEDIRRLTNWRQITCIYSSVIDQEAFNHLLATTMVLEMNQYKVVLRVNAEQVPDIVKHLLYCVQSVDLGVTLPSLKQVLTFFQEK